MNSQGNKIYFEGLNALRFFAALAVIITHIELSKNSYGIQNCWASSKIVFNLGGLGVYFFFVLSGFLITYLLMIEKENTGTIDIKKFYMRRILRIWPLYFLLVFIGFFILPMFETLHIPFLETSFHNNFYFNLALFLVMLPNLAFALFPAVPHIGHLWSIGVEEQFYVAWPFIVKKSNNLIKTLLVLIVILIIVKLIVLFLSTSYPNLGWLKSFKKLVAMSKFECMAIGGIGAYLYHYKKNIISFVKKPITSVVALFMTTIIVLFVPDNLQDGQHLIISALFLIIILNVVSAEVKWLTTQLFDFLGKISYGIYMYHFMVLPIVIVLLTKFIQPVGNLFLFNLLLYSFSILITVVVAWLSYKFFELRFIKLKNKFTIIHSGKD